MSLYSRKYKAAISVPSLAWVVSLILIPYLILLAHSFWAVSDHVIVHSWNLSNYRSLFQNPMYISVLLRSVRIALVVTGLSICLSYPLALFLSLFLNADSKLKPILYQMVIIPLWISYLVRGYAWKTILGNDGVLNGVLQYLHLTHAPLEFLLYSPLAVIITLTHIYTPFVFLPVYASLEKLPRQLLEASSDLGASPWQTFTTVILPLSLPGVITGATFAFVLSLGDFLAPILVGGPSGIMISNVVVSLFGAAYNWPLGAALAFLLLFFVLIILHLSDKLSHRFETAL